MSNKRTSKDEDEILCLCIEGGLVTSTPEFIQTLIDKYEDKKDIRSISLKTRLNNIKENLRK